MNKNLRSFMKTMILSCKKGDIGNLPLIKYVEALQVDALVPTHLIK